MEGENTLSSLGGRSMERKAWRLICLLTVVMVVCGLTGCGPFLSKSKYIDFKKVATPPAIAAVNTDSQAFADGDFLCAITTGNSSALPFYCEFSRTACRAPGDFDSTQELCGDCITALKRRRGYRVLLLRRICELQWLW